MNYQEVRNMITNLNEALDNMVNGDFESLPKELQESIGAIAETVDFTELMVEELEKLNK